MQRIMVDLPEPEGPQTTMRSFWPTASDTSRRTCIWPYHLLTFSSRIAGGPELSARWGISCAAAVWLIGGLLPGAWPGLAGGRPSSAVRARELALEPAAVAGHRVAEDDVDRGDDEIH